MFDNLLHPVLSPLLGLPSLWAVVILSLIISLMITLIYKFTTNQSLMKDLKAEMKEFQNEMKELRAHPDKMMEVQKKAMQTNMKYMSHSMKSTLFTFLPIIIIFGWMSSHLAFAPIMPGSDFSTTIYAEKGVEGFIEINIPQGINLQGEAKKEIKDGKVFWTLNADAGEYLLEYNFNENKKYSSEVLITENNEYKPPVKTIKDGNIKTIETGLEKNIVLNLFGWKLGWLGTYIIFSIAFSMIIRKILKVY